MSTTRIHQHGAALATAMIVLLILTILGVRALDVTSMESIMAVSIQEKNRAFEAAESGLGKAMNSTALFSLYEKKNGTFDFGTGRIKTTAAVTTSFGEYTAPPRGSGFSSIQFDSAHFSIESKGETAGQAKAEVSQGMYQIIPKQQ